MKKLITLIAIVASVAMLSMSAFALSVVEEGNVVKINADAAGDYEGTLTLILGGGLTVADVDGAGLAIYNPDNGQIGIAAVGVREGRAVVEIEFAGEGTWSLTAEGGMAAVGTVSGTVGGGTVEPPPPLTCPDCGNEVCTCETIAPPPPVDPDDKKVTTPKTLEDLNKLDFDALKALADSLGIDYADGIDATALRALIAAFLDLNPKAGVALAIVPAIVAAAAVVITRKRK
jgi:hypothetical protein